MTTLSFTRMSARFAGRLTLPRTSGVVSVDGTKQARNGQGAAHLDADRSRSGMTWRGRRITS